MRSMTTLALSQRDRELVRAMLVDLSVLIGLSDDHCGVLHFISLAEISVLHEFDS
jgi:hypothetical protein